MQRKTDVIFDPPGWWAGSLGWRRGLWVDIWQVDVCVYRERTIEWWSFKVALMCLCVAGTKLTAQLPLQAIKWTVHYF